MDHAHAPRDIRTGPAAPAAGPVSGRLSVAPDGAGWWARARWFVRGVMGENAYQAYLLHHERSGHEGPAMTEKEYWRSRTDWQETHPEGRCC